MSNYTLNRIREEKMIEAKKEVETRIMCLRRMAQAKRIIAANFDGAYITKRVEDRILSVIPGAKRVYLSQCNYSDNISVSINYSDGYSNDTRDEIILCKKNERRLNAAKLLDSAKGDELDAMKKENILHHIDKLVQRYNIIAKQYADIEQTLSVLFHDLPSSDCDCRSKAEAGITPDEFLEAISA